MTRRWRKMTREVSWSVDPSVVASLLSLTFAERSPPMTPPRRPRTFPPDACPIKGIPRGPKTTGVSTDEDASAASEVDMLLKVSSSVSLTSASLPSSRR